MSDKIDWYTNYIKDELSFLESRKFYGNMTFQVNVKEGHVQSMNIGLNNNVKMSDEREVRR